MSDLPGLISEPLGTAAGAQPGSLTLSSEAWEGQDWFGTTRQIGRAIDRAVAVNGIVDPETGIQMRAPEPTVEPATLQDRYGIPGHLTFATPLPESVARSMYEAKREELMRQDAAARTPPGFETGASRMIAGFITGALDPVNLAASFVPGLGEARIAETLGLGAAQGFAARSAVRALSGASAGVAGQAALSGLRYGMSSQDQQDYSALQAMSDIAFGGVLGGGLHTLIGGVGDVIGRRFADSAAARVVAADPQARAAALNTAVAAVAEDRPVEVTPGLDAAALQSSFAARLEARGETASGNYATYTPNGMRVELRPEVVELGDLIASHDETGAVNPAFPHAEGMQPRDRTSAASQAQIAEMASRLEPERLGPSPEASTGAPIVNGDGVVESGNGRILALRRVFSDPALADQATAYRAMLAARGHDVQGMQAPVLIGRRITDLAPDQAQAFVRSANERATLGMNAAEQARLDAKRAAAAIGAFRTGPLNARANSDFIAGFMAQVPAEERAGMMLGNGTLSAVGEARIRAAVLAHAYGDALGPTLERMLNGDVDHMKGVAGALADTAGTWSRMREAAARGTIPAGLDITPAIGEAVQLLDRARSLGMSPAALLAQQDLVGGPSEAAAGLLRLMFRDEAMRQPVARAKLANLLDRYAEEAMEAKAGPGLFGEAETSPADILRAIGAGDARMEAAAAAQTSDAARRAQGAPAPDDATVSAAADRAAAAPPKLPTEVPPERVAELDDFVARARDAGALTAADEADLAAADAMTKEATDTGNAFAEAAACMIRSGGG